MLLYMRRWDGDVGNIGILGYWDIGILGYWDDDDDDGSMTGRMKLW